MPLQAYTPADLTLTERGRLEKPLLWMIWLGAAGFSLAEGHLFYLLASTFAVSINYLAVRRRKEFYIQRIFVNIGVLLATVVLLLEVATTRSPLLVALGHYLILIQLCKLFERKRNRDYIQMIALSLLLMLAGTLVTEAIWFAAVMLVHLLLTVYTTMVFTLKRGLDAAADARLGVEAGPLELHQVAWNVTRTWPKRALRRRLVAAMGTVLLVGIVMFLVTPRVLPDDPGLLGIERSRPGGTGFGEDVTLGDVSEVYQSDQVVMTVQASDPDLLAEGRFYLRGRVFQRYGHSRWLADRGPHTRFAVTPPGPPASLTADAQTLEISQDPSLLPVLFTPYPTHRVEVYTPAGPRTVMVRPSMEASYIPPRTAIGPARYRLEYWPGPLSEGQTNYLSLRGRFTESMGFQGRPSRSVEVPDRVVQLARSWCEDLLARRAVTLFHPARGQLDLAIAQRIATKLKENYSYTLDLSDAEPRRDGVEDFLFHMKKGHCEYFASALTAMCRVLDVRARLVVGFVIDPETQQGDQYIVRSRYAHAWTEVYSPDSQWVIVDATPAGSFEAAAGDSWMDSLADRWEELRFFWYDKVIGYDNLSRQQLLDGLGEMLVGIGEAFEAAWDALAEGFQNLLVHGEVDQALARLAMVLFVLAAWIELLIIYRWWRKRKRRQASPTYRARQTLSFLRLLLDRFEKLGHAPRPDQTLRESTASAARQLDLPVEEVTGLVDLFYRVRWGNAALTDQEVRHARQRTEVLLARLR